MKKMDWSMTWSGVNNGHTYQLRVFTGYKLELWMKSNILGQEYREVGWASWSYVGNTRDWKSLARIASEGYTRLMLISIDHNEV